MGTKSFWNVFFFSMICLWGAGNAMASGRGSEASDRQDKLNGGYYLLHHLCEDEVQLPLLVAIKHTPPDIVDYVDRIAKTAHSGLDTMDRIKKGNSSVQFDKNPLPPIEIDVRASIRETKQHQLVFGTTDKAFVRALLISQIEATSYGLHLAKVLAEQDPDRSKALQALSAKWSARNDEAYKLLANL